MITISEGNMAVKGKKRDIVKDLMNFVEYCLDKEKITYGTSGDQIQDIFNLHSLLSMIFACCSEDKELYKQLLAEIEIVRKNFETNVMNYKEVDND